MASTQVPAADKADEQESQKVEKGTQHPTQNLETTVTDLETLQKAVGYGVVSREMSIRAWGYTSLSGRASTRLGAQSHFGLIERTGKGSFKISDLGKRILVPTSPEERQLAIADAATRPTLYKKLIDRYRDGALPGMLGNLLIRDFGVFPGSATNAARVFRETVEFAGLLRSGVLYTEPALDGNEAESVNSTGVKSDDGRSAPPPPNPEPPTIAGRSAQRYTIPLDHTGRLADIQVPIPVTKRDLRKIAAWVQYATDNFFDEPDETDATRGES